MEESTGRKLHKDASKAREAGDFLKALQFTDEAMLAYQSDRDLGGFSEILAERSLSLRHLAESSEDKNFLTIAKGEMNASVAIARTAKDDKTLPIPLFNLAKVLEDLGETKEAEGYYREAVEKAERVFGENRPAVILDMKIHLYANEYANGDKSALEKAEAAMASLAAVGEAMPGTEGAYNELDFYQSEDAYNKKVWLSGGHMKIARMLREADKQKAKTHLEEAKKILDSDERLILRFKQWQKLAGEFV